MNPQLADLPLALLGWTVVHIVGWTDPWRVPWPVQRPELWWDGERWRPRTQPSTYGESR